MILTQLSCTSSFLNHDLCKVYIISSPACSCGGPQKVGNHFFFVCTKYSKIRNDLFLSISDSSQLINTSLFTSGSETLKTHTHTHARARTHARTDRQTDRQTDRHTHTHTHTHCYMIKLYFSCFLVHSQYNVIMIVYRGEDSISW